MRQAAILPRDRYPLREENPGASSFPGSHTSIVATLARTPERAEYAVEEQSLTSALGQKQTLGKVQLMSALPPKADNAESD